MVHHLVEPQAPATTWPPTAAAAPESTTPQATPTAATTPQATPTLSTTTPSAVSEPGSSLSPQASLLDASWGDFISADVSPPPPTATLPPQLPTPTPMAEVVVDAVAVEVAVDVDLSADTNSPPIAAPVAPPEPVAPLPAPEVGLVASTEAPAPPAIARWAYPKLARPASAPPPVGEFEALQPFDMDILDGPSAAPEVGAVAVVAPPTPPALDLAVEARVEGKEVVVAPIEAVVVAPIEAAVVAQKVDARIDIDIDIDDSEAMPAPVVQATPPPAPVPPVAVAMEVVAAVAPQPSFPSPKPSVVESVTVPTPSSQAVPEERVMRQSVRFDEPRTTSRPPMPALQPPTPALQPAAAATTLQPSAPTPAAASTPVADASSPWDGDAGPARALDLDVVTRSASPLETLLRTPAANPTQPPAPQSREPVPAEPVDELTALMTGARELFELGDFSGSLELVEKVLRTNPEHEGARAYLKRNEATLLRMYESKLGNMGTIPRQLVPPDEVIWLNMHHRAGFILSQVDGTLAYEDLLDVSGMDRFDTVRILAELVQNGIIG